MSSARPLLAAAVWLLLCQIGASVRWWKWGGDQKETRPLRTGLCKTREERLRLREHGHAELCLAIVVISRRLVFNCVRLTQKRPAAHPGEPLRVLRGIKIPPRHQPRRLQRRRRRDDFIGDRLGKRKREHKRSHEQFRDTVCSAIRMTRASSLGVQAAFRGSAKSA